MKKLLLILYSNQMYDQTANAIIQYFGKNYNHYDVVAVDEVQFTNFSKAKRRKANYIRTARKFMFANNYYSEYKQMSFLKKGKPLAKLNMDKIAKQKFKALRIKFRKLENVLSRYTPSVVVCTTPTAHCSLAKAIQKWGLEIPYYIVSSDFQLNRAFINPFANGYFVQNQLVKKQLIANKIASDKIEVVGNAVVNELFVCLDKQEIREKYGIENSMPIILLTAGRYANGYIKDYFEKFSKFENKFNLLVLTGENKNFVKYIQKLCQDDAIKKNIFAVDKIAKIGDILSITDIIVTSPTSQVTYEAILRQIPTILIKPLNKTEKNNAKYLIENKLALEGFDSKKALETTINLIDDAEMYGSIVDSLEGKYDLNSTQLLCESLAKIMRSQEPIEPEPQTEIKQEEQLQTENVKIKKSKFAGLFNKNKNKNA